jgi:serine/threonine protein kinase/small basic protein
MPWTNGHSLQNGKYIIEEVLGQGGFGITYKVLDTDSDEYVVIKTPNEYLKHDPDYSEYVDRFIKEGQKLARMSEYPHPHIVRYRRVFNQGEIPCLVMDFMSGENLFQLVQRRGAIPEAEIVPCIRQVGQALTVIHQAGLVHCDAHPGNILVQPGGNAVLIDFGIAKDLMPSSQSSTSEAGNRGFAPYEQVSKGSRNPNVDVYCLAATLYYAVTGQRPSTALERKLYKATLIPPERLRPSISRQLDRAILKGMALEPKHRPQSMQKWLGLLKTPIAQQSSVDATDQTAFEECRKLSAELKMSAELRQRPVVERRSRAIPWKSLLVVLTGHVIFMAYNFASLPYAPPVLLVAFSAMFSIWSTISIVSMGSVSKAKEIAEDFRASMLKRLPVIAIVTGIVAGIVAGIVTKDTVPTVLGALSVAAIMAIFLAVFGFVHKAWSIAVAVAGEKLLESFSRSDTFLILVGTYMVGMGLAWLIGTALRSSGFVHPTFGML